ncbi:MAG: hypothetical protein V2A73_05815 [Pseudomonadota bacterium]
MACFRKPLVLLATLALTLTNVGSIGEAFANEGKEMEFEPEEIARSGPESKVLSRAKKLYDRKDYYSASIEFYKVIQGDTNDSEMNRQKAEFFLGKTLYQMKFYAGALAFFDRIIQQGGAHRFYGITLKWLAALAKVLPESAGILERIGKYSRQDLEEPVFNKVRHELYYLLGRHFYRQGGSQGSFDQAVELFSQVPRTSEHFVSAKFFEGVTRVRQGKGAPALDAFKEILRIAKEPELAKNYKAQDIREYEELANLSMARVFYSTQQYDLSIKYFEKIPQDSALWVGSLFEASWAYFMKKSYSKALGNIHTLTAPFFENEFFPESVNLKAVIYFNYCRYDRAEESVSELLASFLPLRDELRKLVKKHAEDDAAFYALVKKIRAGKAGLPERVERLAQTALQDRTLLKTFDFVDELEREFRQHDGADKAWKTTAVAAEVLQELTVQQSIAEAKAGQLARDRLGRLTTDLNDLARDARKIRIEILEARAGQKKAELQGQEIAAENRPESILVDDEHQTWEFSGEYWKDELGFYRFRAFSVCPKKQ